MPRLYIGAAIDRSATINTTIPPILEDVWQQPQETQLIFIHINSTTENNNSIHTPEINNKIVVQSHTSPIRKTSAQVSGSNTEPFLENQTRNIPVRCLNDSRKRQQEVQRKMSDMTTNESGDDNTSPPKKNFTN